MLQLEQYNRDLESTKAHTDLVDEGKMRKEEFIAMHSLYQTPFLGTEDLRPHDFTEPHSITHPSSSAPTSQPATLDPYEPFPPKSTRRFPNKKTPFGALYL